MGVEIAKSGTRDAFFSTQEVVGMHYFVFGMGGAAIVFIGRRIYVRLERWNRFHRLRGARECLEAVHDTLDSLAKSKPKVGSRWES